MSLAQVPFRAKAVRQHDARRQRDARRQDGSRHDTSRVVTEAARRPAPSVGKLFLVPRRDGRRGLRARNARRCPR